MFAANRSVEDEGNEDENTTKTKRDIGDWRHGEKWSVNQKSRK